VSDAEAVEAALDAAGVPWRRVAEGEWGLVAEAGGWDLHVGVALRDGLLGAQAEVLPPGRADPHLLLHRNRRLRLVRFAHTAAGAVWVQGELPSAAVTAAEVDRLLGLLVQAAADARGATSSR
jgi:Putative bacterial sensory transduction regulator